MDTLVMIATYSKFLEDLLFRSSISNDHETVIIKPNRESIKNKLRYTKRLGRDREIIFFVDKEVMEMTRSEAEKIQLDVKFREITGEEDTMILLKQLGEEDKKDTVHLVMANERLDAEFSDFFGNKGYEVILRALWRPEHMPGIFEAIISPRSFGYKLRDIRSRDLLLIEYALAETIRREGGQWIGDVADALRSGNPVVFRSYPLEPEVRLMDFLDLTLGFVLPRDTPDEFWRRWQAQAR